MASTAALASAWCDKLEKYCLQLQTDCASLHAIVQRKPELESRGSTFDTIIDDLNDDVSSAMAELQHIEKRTTDTLSFEELLVHCSSLYNSNEDGITKLELQLQQYGYTPVEPPKSIPEALHAQTKQAKETEFQNLDESFSPTRSRGAPAPLDDAAALTPMSLSYERRDIKKSAEYSPLFGDLGDLGSLKSLGISATSLTALASQAYVGNTLDAPDEGAVSVHPHQHKLFVESPTKKGSRLSVRDDDMDESVKTKFGNDWVSVPEQKPPSLPSPLRATTVSLRSGDDERHVRSTVSSKPVNEYAYEAVNSTPASNEPKNEECVESTGTRKLKLLDEVTNVQYDKCPSWLKFQVSLQEINDAVIKINDLIKQRSSQGGHANQYVLDQEDFEALGFGSKAKAGHVLLVKADKLVTQYSKGVTTYRICI